LPVNGAYPIGQPFFAPAANNSDPRNAIDFFILFFSQTEDNLGAVHVKRISTNNDFSGQITSAMSPVDRGLKKAAAALFFWHVEGLRLPRG
jgi:hypothetical protein